MALFTPRVTYAETVQERCQKRVKILNSRGKKMAKKSKVIQTKYKAANAGWKTKISDNKKFATKYAEDDRLSGKTDILKKEIKEFQLAVKSYNNVKRPYIAERNSQIKSYKAFKADCNTGAGRVAALEKMRARFADSQTLNTKSKAVSEVYKSKVRAGILDMRNARADIIKAKKGLREVAKASQSSIDESVTSEDTDTDDESDNEFDEDEMNDPNNDEE